MVCPLRTSRLPGRDNLPMASIDKLNVAIAGGTGALLGGAAEALRERSTGDKKIEGKKVAMVALTTGAALASAEALVQRGGNQSLIERLRLRGAFDRLTGNLKRPERLPSGEAVHDTIPSSSAKVAAEAASESLEENPAGIVGKFGGLFSLESEGMKRAIRGNFGDDAQVAGPQLAAKYGAEKAAEILRVVYGVRSDFHLP